MNIFNIIIAKVSNTVTVILMALGLQFSPTPLVESPVADPVTVVVATATSTEPEGVTTTPLMKPVVVATTTVTSTATTTPVVQATTSPVVVPVVTLPTTTYQVAPTQAPQTVIIQIQQPEAPVASASIPMGKTYTLNKGAVKVLDNVSEAEVRKFAETINDQIAWKKAVRTAELSTLSEALEANGYTLVENE